MRRWGFKGASQQSTIMSNIETWPLHFLILRPGPSISSISGPSISLGEIKDARAVPPLTEALADVKAYVRREAAWSLAKLDTSPP